MNPKLYIKINHGLLALILISIVLLEGNYWALLQKKVLPMNPRYMLWASIIFIMLFFIKRGKRKGIEIVPWVIYLVLVVVRNQEFANGGYLNTVRIVLCLLTLMVCCYSIKWIETAPKLIFGIGLANVFATIAFYLSDSLYRKFISMTYKTYQAGTNFGLYGYRAALADHYSQNGTYIAIVFITVGSILVSNGVKKQSKKYFLVLTIVSMVALLLTAKRAHLIFSVAALVFSYYASNPSKRIGHTFKLIIALIVILFLGTILIDYIPQLADTFNRFQTIGEDNASLNRIIMWEYAWKTFEENMFFGIGWFGFRYETEISNILIDATTGAHNVYLEVLCECGIFGFGCFIVAVGSSLLSTLINLSKSNMNDTYFQYRSALAVSFVIQVFALMYSFTGNMIYDRTFHFYIVAVAINLAFSMNQAKIGK